MIKEWSLKRFKSVAGRQILPFRPLTIFTGANSSGKSTVLQSILLVCQTLASKVERRHVMLNGSLVRLGTLDDILSQTPGPPEFSIGWKLEPSPSLLTAPRAVHLAQPWTAWFHAYRHQRFVVEADLTFGRPIDPSEAAGVIGEVRHAELLSATFSSSTSSEQEPGEALPTGMIKISRRDQRERDELFAGSSVEQISRENLRLALRYDVDAETGPAAFRYYAAHDMQGGTLVGSMLEHFMPQYVVSRFGVVEQKISEKMREFRHAEDLDAMARELKQSPDQVLRALGDFLSEWNQGESAPSKVRGLRRKPTLAYREALEAVKARLHGQDVLNKTAFGIMPPTDLMSLIRTATGAEFSAIRYLGPLRSEPRPLHDIGSEYDPKDVGTRGEFTAAVLDMFRQVEVEFVQPNEPMAKPQRVPLHAAVHAWLKHLDIADHFETREEGKLGHRLFVRPRGIAGNLDLTNVGVGVSQVLPILVMALMSDPGSVLLFEQPELHLHPRVQSQLADFFLAVIRTGRQCIVETHSEYLINRLRLRIAESEWGSDLGNTILLYFTERVGAQSNFEPVAMNAYGAIPNWPVGFFDQGPTEAESIARAAMAKRNARGKAQ